VHYSALWKSPWQVEFRDYSLCVCVRARVILKLVAGGVLRAYRVAFQKIFLVLWAEVLPATRLRRRTGLRGEKLRRRQRSNMNTRIHAQGKTHLGVQ
jgi:hypothetical protein